eukprot:NODE_1310_length_640_cov_613.478849_g917_i0.p1 GENE.NODE_1310_length_640_cov_613.478849_g917_i0~~NODE_1310_length_640_cov_613.478849_g917_i0.p1  ORF type:complete len:150 (+),score=52.09 NODE_1310_length_640_cov_613.478849_g917_i0:40-489(+)
MEELQSWLLEEKGMDPETLPQSELKRHFDDYMEDYNLGILPERYVNIRRWEAKQQQKRLSEASKVKRKKKGVSMDDWVAAAKGLDEGIDGGIDLDPEEARRKEIQRGRELRKAREEADEQVVQRMEMAGKQKDAMITSLTASLTDRFQK